MAFLVTDLRSLASKEELLDFDSMAATLVGLSLPQAIDLACLDDEDIAFVFPDPEVAHVAKMFKGCAAEFKAGWASLSAMDVKTKAPVTTEMPPVPIVPEFHSVRQVQKSSIKDLRAASKSFAAWVALGVKLRASIRKAGPKSSVEKAKSDMEAALRKVHAVFVDHAQDSPRFLELRQGPEIMKDMQLQSYRMGSRSARVVAQRARTAEMFFLDFRVFGWQVASATPFQVATWVRSRAADAWMVPKLALAHLDAYCVWCSGQQIGRYISGIC